MSSSAKKVSSSILAMTCFFSALSLCATNANGGLSNEKDSTSTAVAKLDSGAGSGDVPSSADLDDLKILALKLLAEQGGTTSSSSQSNQVAVAGKYSANMAKQAIDLALFNYIKKTTEKMDEKKPDTYWEKGKSEILAIGKDIRTYAAGVIAVCCTGILTLRYLPENLKNIVNVYVEAQVAEQRAKIRKNREEEIDFEAKLQNKELYDKFVKDYPVFAKWEAFFKMDRNALWSWFKK